MKKNLSLILIVLSVAFSTKTNAQYIDLSTGKTIAVVKNESNGMMYNPQTQRPVHIYINPTTHDTFYGRTGANINGKTLKGANGAYNYNDESGYVFSNGEFRMRNETDSAGYRKVFKGNGDVKVKYGDYKRKDELDGDVKAKDLEAKTKTKPDGRLKEKDGDYRKKIDGEGNMRVKDDSSKVKLNADGSVKVKDHTEGYKGKVDENGKMKEKDADMKKKVKADGKVKVKNKENSGNRTDSTMQSNP